jgi:hypothetical protein
MQQKIRELRVEIDGLSQLVKSLKVPTTFTVEDFGIIKSKEIDKSYDSLILAKAWLGKILQQLGEPTPYKSDGNRHSKEDIESTADKSLPIELKVQLNETKPIGASVRDMNHIEKVDWLRQEIQKLYLTFQNFDLVDFDNIISKRIKDNIYNYLSEARFFLGFELQRLKEE